MKWVIDLSEEGDVKSGIMLSAMMMLMSIWTSIKIIPLATNFFGKGDGGHGPTHQEVAEANAYASLGFCKWSRVHDFYHELEKQG